MVPGSETKVTRRSPQYGEKPSHNEDVVPEPQVEISKKSRSAEYSNRGEKARVMAV